MIRQQEFFQTMGIAESNQSVIWCINHVVNKVIAFFDLRKKRTAERHDDSF